MGIESLATGSTCSSCGCAWLAAPSVCWIDKVDGGNMAERSTATALDDGKVGPRKVTPRGPRSCHVVDRWTDIPHQQCYRMPDSSDRPHRVLRRHGVKGMAWRPGRGMIHGSPWNVAYRGVVVPCSSRDPFRPSRTCRVTPLGSLMRRTPHRSGRHRTPLGDSHDERPQPLGRRHPSPCPSPSLPPLVHRPLAAHVHTMPWM